MGGIWLVIKFGGFLSSIKLLMYWWIWQFSIFQCAGFRFSGVIFWWIDDSVVYWGIFFVFGRFENFVDDSFVLTDWVVEFVVLGAFMWSNLCYEVGWGGCVLEWSVECGYGDFWSSIWLSCGAGFWFEFECLKKRSIHHHILLLMIANQLNFDHRKNRFK